MNAMTRTVEHLVIGGGPAGAMAAIKLAEAGRQVLLVEKEPGPHHKVCGEFLSREAIEYLHGVSIFPEDLGAAPIRFLRLSTGSKLAESELPFQALALSRRTLDAAMLARAAAAGCEVQRGAAVESLRSDDTGWVVKLAGGECIAARMVILATGKHDLHGWNRARGTHGDLVGFKIQWRLDSAQTTALRGATELFLFPGGYGGLLPVENGAVNFCLVVRRSKLRDHGSWDAVFAALLGENRHLRRRLDGAASLQPRALAISPIPYGYFSTRLDGVWRTGDQAAVIPSFTGDGISIALHSASLAAEMCLAGRSSDEYMQTLRRQLRQRMRLATWLSRAMVTTPGRCAAPVVLTVVPWIMRSIAAATRIPEAALLHGLRGLPCSSDVTRI